MNCVDCNIITSGKSYRCSDCKRVHDNELRTQRRIAKSNQLRQCPDCGIQHKSPGYCNARCLACHNKNALQYSHAYGDRHPGRKLATRKKWIKANYQQVKEYQKMWFETHREEQRQYAKKGKKVAMLKIKLEVITAYGGKCTCPKCPETRTEFLTVDHVNGGGRQHRKDLGLQGGYQFYNWLRKQGFPKDKYQLLCFNCNCAKGIYGECPHITV